MLDASSSIPSDFLLCSILNSYSLLLKISHLGEWAGKLGPRLNDHEKRRVT